MVSLKTIFGRLKYLLLFVLFLSAGSFAFASLDSDLLLCRKGYKKCCVNGTMTCVDENDTNYKFCLISCGTIIDPIETCGTSGQVQYKPSGSCGTTSRTCCSSGSWSDWDKECPKTCDGKKPTTSQSCGTNGTQTRIVTCDTSTGKWVEGNWGPCKEKVCNKGDMRTCPSNKNQVQYCLSDGSGWATTCRCENEGNGVVYCRGMRLTTDQACMHGIWSDKTCSGICCCAQDTPKLMSNGYPGCWGTRKGIKDWTTTGWQYSCSCQRPGSGGLMPDL